MNTVCSTYIPSDLTKKASFFPSGFIEQFYGEFLSNFPLWKNFTVDSSNAKSSFFGFRIADLESILSGLSNLNLLDKI